MRRFRRSRALLAIVALGVVLLAGAAWAHASLHVHTSGATDDCAPCRLLHLCSAADRPVLASLVAPDESDRLSLTIERLSSEGAPALAHGRAPPLAG